MSNRDNNQSNENINRFKQKIDNELSRINALITNKRRGTAQNNQPTSFSSLFNQPTDRPTTTNIF